MRRLIVLPLVAAALIAGGCGGGGSSGSTASIPSADAPAASTPDTSTAPATTGPRPQKPTVKVPSGPAPKHLVIKDLEKGTGPEAKDGDNLTVDYVGVLYDNGKQFDASWDDGDPLQFQLGSGQVIPGWDQGIKGMKVGGRRELIIPASMAYGTEGSPPTIPPNAALVFVVDLEGIST